ncbi:VOC family protein [Stenotrophomonas sp. 24(2023)]|uniref:VOC family protein n=1 Tax=Stenotrophomonas sp. 24(2023) TaxID=3068324 RepID=UPI0027DEAF49|nr:VOC family protein [Stenotrophomonas sp. 24(2023)]WMJ70863.1 VOC family protein [Stenotrophomonas sp. 24(2023)]
MRILELSLPVSDVAATARYFRDVLQQPVEGNAVRIGWSTITLVPAGALPVGGVHLAFNVPDDRFAAAIGWLRERAPLQRNPDGIDYFVLESNWQSQSVYFTGPDGMVLELIGRRRLPVGSRSGPFHGSELTSLSEVGLPSTDVDGLRTRLEADFGLQALSPPTPQFAPMGDDEGLLIVVDAARRWFPEGKDLPSARGLQLRLAGVSAGAGLADAAQGWQLRAA